MQSNETTINNGETRQGRVSVVDSSCGDDDSLDYCCYDECIQKMGEGGGSGTARTVVHPRVPQADTGLSAPPAGAGLLCHVILAAHTHTHTLPTSQPSTLQNTINPLQLTSQPTILTHTHSTTSATTVHNRTRGRGAGRPGHWLLPSQRHKPPYLLRSTRHTNSHLPGKEKKMHINTSRITEEKP